MRSLICFCMVKVLLITLLTSTSLFATKYTAAFLNCGAGARALGMGGSFSALGLDATTIHWNPAVMGRLAQPELVLMHSAQFNNFLKYDTGHFVWPNTISGSFGIGYLRLATGDIFFTENLRFHDWGRDNLPGTGDPGEGNGAYDRGERIIYEPGRLKVVNDTEEALFLAYARSITPKLALGGNIKIIRQAVGHYSATGWGFDVGAFYQITSKLSLALTLQDVFGTNIRWQTGHSDIRTINVKPGMAYKIDLSKINSHLYLASDVDIRFDRIKRNCDFHLGRASFDFHLGLEYWFYRMLAMRIGTEQRSLTAGTGIRLGFFEIDYAFTGFDLGNTHRISLTLHRPTRKQKSTTEADISIPVQPEEEISIEPQHQPEPTIEIQPQQAEKDLKRTEKPTVGVDKEKSILTEILIGTILFESGSAVLTPTAHSELKLIIEELANYPHQIIKVVGHTDNRPIHTSEFPTNDMLSVERAWQVKKFLIINGNIQAERIEILGMGALKPVTSNDSSAGRRLNRRAEIYITPQKISQE